METAPRTFADRVAYILAIGGGIGLVPYAPGTFGSLVGLGWLLGLVNSRSILFYFATLIFMLPIAVWACSRAALLLGRSDPSCVVLDEILALPWCSVAWVIEKYWHDHRFLELQDLLSNQGILRLAVIFFLFRLFDIWKPWIIGKSQRLPGGFGIVLDDWLAALTVNLVFGLLIWGQFFS